MTLVFMIYQKIENKAKIFFLLPQKNGQKSSYSVIYFNIRLHSVLYKFLNLTLDYEATKGIQYTEF